MTMNVDFLALSSAVHQANQDGAARGGGSGGDDTPTRKLPARRRSSLGGSSSALQFLEAAQMIWTELPSGETPALQRRRSSRSGAQLKDALSEFNDNKSSSSCFDGERSLAKLGSSSSRRKLPKRRASMGSVMSALDEEKPSTQQSTVVKTTNRRGRLIRRSSIQPKDANREGKKNASAVADAEASPSRPTPSKDKKQSLPVRRFVSDPTPPSPEIKAKLKRRNTIMHTGSMDDSSSSMNMSMSKSSKQGRRSSISKTASGGGNKATVRFELDHKNRIKRRVSFIRKQNARTSDSTLWWSQEELDRIYERENKVYEKFADNKVYKRKIQKLWGSCSKASSGSPLTPEVIAHVAGSPSRGLEVDILETVRDRRARVIRSLLDAQETLRDFDPNIRAKVLSARYKNLCKAATRFARKMGEGDEMEAANIYSPATESSTATTTE